MPIEIKIIPKLGLMYARFEGDITVPEARIAFKSYMSDPAFAEGQKQLLDFSRITGFTSNPAEMFQFLAKLEAETPSTRSETMFVYYVTSELTRSIVHKAFNALSQSSRIVMRVVETEEAAMDVLGLPYATIAEMLESAEQKTVSVVSG